MKYRVSIEQQAKDEARAVRLEENTTTSKRN